MKKPHLKPNRLRKIAEAVSKKQNKKVGEGIVFKKSKQELNFQKKKMS